MRATAPGGFPATQPDLWLRIQRQGKVITGYAGTDGRTWTRLGSMTLVWLAEPRVGLAVSSQNAGTSTTARFRALGPTASTNELAWSHSREAAHPSSRSTQEVDLSGCILTDSLDTPRFRIPPDTRIAPDQHLAWDEAVLGFALRAAGETASEWSPNPIRLPSSTHCLHSPSTKVPCLPWLSPPPMPIFPRRPSPSRWAPIAPTGMTVDPVTGLLRWTLPADSGPTVLTAHVRVTDAGSGAFLFVRTVAHADIGRRCRPSGDRSLPGQCPTRKLDPRHAAGRSASRVVPHLQLALFRGRDTAHRLERDDLQ